MLATSTLTGRDAKGSLGTYRDREIYTVLRTVGHFDALVTTRGEKAPSVAR